MERRLQAPGMPPAQNRSRVTDSKGNSKLARVCTPRGPGGQALAEADTAELQPLSPGLHVDTEYQVF